LQIGEEVAHAAQIVAEGGIVGDVAEILRTLVVADIADMAGIAARLVRFVIVAFLVPAPEYRGAVLGRDERNVLPCVMGSNSSDNPNLIKHLPFEPGGT
jgi:hypothetical protein